MPVLSWFMTNHLSFTVLQTINLCFSYLPDSYLYSFFFFWKLIIFAEHECSFPPSHYNTVTHLPMFTLGSFPAQSNNLICWSQRNPSRASLGLSARLTGTSIGRWYTEADIFFKHSCDWYSFRCTIQTSLVHCKFIFINYRNEFSSLWPHGKL